MRALVVTQNITADGSIEMLGDWFDAQGQADQTDLIEEIHRQDTGSRHCDHRQHFALPHLDRCRIG